MKLKPILVGIFLSLLVFPLIKSDPMKLETVYSMFAEIYKEDTGVLKNISVDIGLISSFPSYQTDYSVKILDPKDKILFDRNIDVSFDVFLEPLKVIEMDKTLIHLRLPYSERANTIRFYHDDKIILEVALSDFICDNNFICEQGENEYNCPQDCKEEKRIPLSLFVLIVVLLTFLIVVFLRYFRK
jgi:hypothetical protein